MTDRELADENSVTFEVTYEQDLALAVALFDENYSIYFDVWAGEADKPAEYVKMRDDLLNNAWIEGLTVFDWVVRAGLLSPQIRESR